MKHEPYTCIRCGHFTPSKEVMRRHFFQRKTICPATSNDVELTDAIKNYILANRLYRIPSPPKVTQQINNYNSVLNIVTSMDAVEKVVKYIEYKKLDPINVEQKLVKAYGNRHERYSQLKGTHNINENDIIEAVDKATKCNKRFTDCAVIYDQKLDRLSIYDDGRWNHCSLRTGIMDLLDKVKLYHLDKYELYLIEMMESTSTKQYDKAQFKSALEYYYRFLVAYDLPPLVDNSLQLADDVKEKYYAIYKKLSETTVASTFKKLKESIVDRIKHNGKVTIAEFNKYIMSIIKEEDEFASLMIQDRRLDVNIA